MRKVVDDTDIAIIGFAGRFPGAKNIDEFWAHLRDGVSITAGFPKDRWSIDREVYPRYADVIRGGFLEDVFTFDPDFFRIKSDRAVLLDPQVRLILESTAEALNQAGYRREDLSGSRTGVFTAAASSEYAADPRVFSDDGRYFIEHRDLVETRNGFVGNLQNMISAVVSHHYNFTGPSFVLTSACSSSLLSVHLACRSINSAEIDLALACASQLYLSPKAFIGTATTGAMSRSGVCRPFSRHADGYILSEGVGVCVLKKLRRALEDGDTVYAVVKSSAVNNDGKTMSTLMPNLYAQRNVMIEALRAKHMSAATIGYLEANGTALEVGDPLELRAATMAFRETTDKRGYCAVGSVESNIGHAAHAAGMASLFKVVLAMMHGKIPPTLHCSELNPKIDFEDSPFYPNMELADWEPIDGVRRAGINAFGFGGTNCHVILEAFRGEAYKNSPAKRTPLPSIRFERKELRPFVMDEQCSYGDAQERNDRPLPQQHIRLSQTVLEPRETRPMRPGMKMSGEALMELLREKLNISRNEIDLDTDIADLGIDSMLLLELIEDLESMIGKKVQPSVMMEYPRIRQLVDYLTGLQDSAADHVRPTATRSRHVDRRSDQESFQKRVLLCDLCGQDDVLLGGCSRRRREKVPPDSSVVDIVMLDALLDNLAGTVRLLVPLRNKKRVEVFVSGKGRPIVLIPPFGMTSRIWAPQMHFLSSEYRVLGVSLPGHGWSDAASDYSIDGISDSILEVLQYLRLTAPIHFVGASFGGVIAQAVATKLKKRAASITLVNSLCDTMTDVDRIIVRKGTQKTAEKNMRNLILYLNKRSERDFRDALKMLDPYERKQLFSFFRDCRIVDAASTLEYGQHLLLQDTRPLISKMNIPILVVVGGEDQVVNNAQSEMIVASAKNAHVLRMRGAGHYCFVTHHEKFNRQLKRFLMHTTNRHPAV